MIVEKIFEKKYFWNILFKRWFPHLLLAIPPARKSSSESSRSGGEKVDKVDFQIVIGGNFFTPYQVSQVQDELACHPDPAAITSAWEKIFLVVTGILKTWAGLTLQSRVVRVDPSWEARATTGGKYTPPSEASEKKLNVFMRFFRFLTPTSCVSTVLSWKLRMKTVQTTLHATITWIIRFQTTSSTNSTIPWCRRSRCL